MDLATLRERGERLSKVYSMENYRAKGEMRANTCFVHAETVEGEVRIQGPRVGAGGDQWVQDSSVFWGGGKKSLFLSAYPVALKSNRTPTC